MDGDSSAPPPFLLKTYDMVDDPSTNSIVSWSSTKSSFIVWKPLEFARDLLPTYFKHKNFSSFVRQLNTYGFRKIDPEQWEFANEEFIRGQRHLLKNIHRRKPIYSHSLQHLQAQGNSPGRLAESEKQELEEEIVRLKQEKGMLVVELQKHTQQQPGVDLQMQSLEESLRNMERRQKQMMAFLSYIIQKPGFVFNFVQQSGNHNKKRRWPNPDYFFQEHDMHGNRDVSIQTRAEQDVLPMRVINTEPFEKMESSINLWENFLCGVSYASGEMYGRGMHRESSCLLLTEIIASSGDPNGNLPQSPMLDTSFLRSRDVDSSPELAESSYVETPSLSAIQNKTSVIDINSKPPGTEVHCSIKRVNVASAGPTKANDGFWEQFLTETPGSTDTQEVQSERRDNEVKNNQRNNCGIEIFGWNKKNLDHLTEQMGQLSPAERKTNAG